MFKCIFLNWNVWISLKMSLNVVPWVRINNIQAFVQIINWRRPGDKPLPDPMMFGYYLNQRWLVTLPQWGNRISPETSLFQMTRKIRYQTNVIINTLFLIRRKWCIFDPFVWIHHMNGVDIYCSVRRQVISILCIMDVSFMFIARKDFKYLRHLSVTKW